MQKPDGDILTEFIRYDLAGHADEEYGDQLAEKPEVRNDGLNLVLKDGSEITVIYPRPDEYSLTWKKGEETILKIDTAPLHSELDTFPNHIHEEGRVRKDDLTSPDYEPVTNFDSVMDHVLKNL